MELQAQRVIRELQAQRVIMELQARNIQTPWLLRGGTNQKQKVLLAHSLYLQTGKAMKTNIGTPIYGR